MQQSTLAADEVSCDWLIAGVCFVCLLHTIFTESSCYSTHSIDCIRA